VPDLGKPEKKRLQVTMIHARGKYPRKEGGQKNKKNREGRGKNTKGTG